MDNHCSKQALQQIVLLQPVGIMGDLVSVVTSLQIMHVKIALTTLRLFCGTGTLFLLLNSSSLMSSSTFSTSTVARYLEGGGDRVDGDSSESEGVAPGGGGTKYFLLFLLGAPLKEKYSSELESDIKFTIEEVPGFPVRYISSFSYSASEIARMILLVCQNLDPAVSKDSYYGQHNNIIILYTADL